MSVTEQRYKAVQGVLAEGRTVSEVASQWEVSRRTLHRWLARYEGGGLEGLGDGSHRPAHCPHQMPAAVEVLVLEMRRAHPYWGARRIAFELTRKGVQPAASESAVYRCLVRAGVIDPLTRRRRRETVDHILTAPRTPTTTGKIERFHRTLRTEFNTRQVFRNLKTAQEALDEWVAYYNTQRPHQSLQDATPESRFRSNDGQVRHQVRHQERNGEQWVSRRVAPNGIVCVDSQHISVGKHYGGNTCDVLVTDGLFQFWVGNELLKTVARTKAGEIRKKHAEHTGPRR